MGATTLRGDTRRLPSEKLSPQWFMGNGLSPIQQRRETQQLGLLITGAVIAGR